MIVTSFARFGNPSAVACATKATTRLQYLLDEGDAAFFNDHPATMWRIRFHFPGERIDGTGEPTRYVVVSRQVDGTLVRRFQRDGGDA
jgi:hypothetical protein